MTAGGYARRMDSTPAPPATTDDEGGGPREEGAGLAGADAETPEELAAEEGFGPVDEEGERELDALAAEAGAADPATAEALSESQDSAVVSGVAEAGGAVDADDPGLAELADEAAESATDAAADADAPPAGDR